MLTSQYQQEAVRTANDSQSPERRRVIAALGLVGEAGELADAIKKFEGHGHKVDLSIIRKEAGDLLWYVAESATACGLALMDVIGSESLTKYQAKINDRKSLSPITTHAIGTAFYASRCACELNLADTKPDIVGASLKAILRELSAVLVLYGLDLGDVASSNVEKLKARYPGGWSTAASVARMDTSREARS